MRRFKTGDRVRYISGANDVWGLREGLTVGETYTVLRADGASVIVRGHEARQQFWIDNKYLVPAPLTNEERIRERMAEVKNES